MARLYVLDLDSTAVKVEQHLDAHMLGIISQQTGIAHPNVSAALPRYLEQHGGAFSISGFIKQLAHEYRIEQTDALTRRIGLLTEEAMRSEVIAYPDTLPVIRRLKDRHATVTVLTHGGADYQELKLRAAGLDTLLDQYSIVKEAAQKPEVMEVFVQVFAGGNEERVTFVDDRLSNLTDMRERFPRMEILHMQRQPVLGGKLPETAAEGEYRVITDLLALI
ncbi:MAG: hypothetical protein TR69_WS6001000540 [candidate division WS6 bacterium OLB20]|uniref:Haloacid dehalogenase-like hydrolase n=1 Tax=candidate division WS6 bacterium OLB20 TaxID=1617426 RepID=A0A136LY16_9BACT|nr:MAG: hypothetical protein TR69_WS6001000540 [candidate division WS6 bacterium OLB20]